MKTRKQYICPQIETDELDIQFSLQQESPPLHYGSKRKQGYYYDEEDEEW